MKVLKRCLAVGTAGLLLLAGCGSSSKPASTPSSTSLSPVAPSSTASAGDLSRGITSNSITIGQLADVSGPIPGLFAGSERGLAAWAAYVNSTGGINGRRIIINFKDDALNCTDYLNDLKDLEQSVAAVVGSATVVDACGETSIKAHPDLLYEPAFTTTYALLNDPNVVQPEPSPPGNPSAPYVYINKTYGSAAGTKTAALYSVTTPTTFQYERNAAESVGFKYVYSRGIGLTETNFTADILRMKNEGVQVVDLSDGVISWQTDFIKQAAQQNFNYKVLIAPGLYDNTFFQLLGDPSLGDRAIMPESYALYLGQDAASVPEITTMTTWVRKQYPNAEIDLYTLFGWVSGLFFEQALKNVSGTPTTASILAAAKGISSFDANGLIPQQNPSSGQAASCTVIIGAKNGQFVRLDPPKSGFDCSLGSFVKGT